MRFRRHFRRWFLVQIDHHHHRTSEGNIERFLEIDPELIREDPSDFLTFDSRSLRAQLPGAPHNLLKQWTPLFHVGDRPAPCLADVNTLLDFHLLFIDGPRRCPPPIQFPEHVF